MKNGEWISVKELLPKFDKPVLGFIADTKPEFMEDYSIEIVYLATVTEHAAGKIIVFKGNDYAERDARRKFHKRGLI